MLIPSSADSPRHFGGFDELVLGGIPTTNHLANAVQLFFENGGKRVYIARVFVPTTVGDLDAHTATGTALTASTRFKARYPGIAGNVQVTVSGLRSGNLLVNPSSGLAINGVLPGDVLEVASGGPAQERVIDAANPVNAANLYVVAINDAGEVRLISAGNDQAIGDVLGAPGSVAQKITLSVTVSDARGNPLGSYAALSTHPDSATFIGRVLRHQDPAAGIEPPVDRSARIHFVQADPGSTRDSRYAYAVSLLSALTDAANQTQTLAGGSDGELATDAGFSGSGEGDDATGLNALAEVEDIAIVAAPGGSAHSDPDVRMAINNALISHCELMRYRFAILAGPRNAGTTEIREVRAQHDSKYAALYHPWLVVRNPNLAVGPGRDTLQLPAEGAMAGIYARSDIERGVHKAPANEVVRGVLRFSQNVNKGIQDVLNPEGINCLRFFEGRGYRVWGARTISSDPEWTYLNVRRLFIFLEHSIDRGTQWAVFEPNNPQLWLKIKLTIENFLYSVWRTGALMGSKPEEGFFVRCDRSTMSQSDLDNGRLVCLIGVAPTKPAEYVIFRIGQWTADASII
jgi:phage tail sheath protein FI